MRFVLIDESGENCNATPYDTEAEALVALRKKIEKLVADPENGLGANYVEDCLGVSLEEASDDELGELLSEVWVTPEGSEGVWTNFSSADRWSVSGMYPEDEQFGNADTRIYRTVGIPSGTTVS
jgi:hypothetical protein